MFEDDKRIVSIVEAINNFGCDVIFNDIQSLKHYESSQKIDLGVLSEIKDKYLNMERPFGFMNATVPAYENVFTPHFIYVASNKNGKELAITTLAHELGHIIDFKKRDDFKDYYNWTPKYKREINAWKEGVSFLLENYVVSKLSIKKFLEDFKYCVDTYKEEEEHLSIGKMEIMAEEVVGMVEHYYKEVVNND